MHRTRILSALLATACLATSLFARTASQDSPPSPLDRAGPLGINLEELRDWNPAWVFTDALQAARPWTPQSPYTLLPWNDGSYLATDEHGWPIPAQGQAAGTILFPDMDGLYPGGIYDVFWRGSGWLKVSLDATLVEQVGPRHARYLVQPSNKGIQLKIQNVDPSDPIRDIRVIHEGFVDSYQTQTFHPEFLEKIEPFGVLRMMQWQNTNFSTLENWADRPLPTDASQATSSGVSVEVMVELANVSRKSPWFCMPRGATDDFVRQFARLVATTLDPTVPVYIEYSNEVWNGAFPSYWHAVTQGTAAGITGFSDFEVAMRWYSERSVEVFDIWQQELEAVSGPKWEERLVRVLSGQHANAYIAEVVLDHEQAYTKCDAIATAPYFGFSIGHGTPAEISATLAKSNAEILSDLQTEITTTLAERTADHVAVAQARGLPLIAYEGGQHLVAPGGPSADKALVQKVTSLNREPGMYDLYRAFLDVWNQEGGQLMAPYSFTGRYTVWGCFGLLEVMDQPLSEAHKMRAILDWKETQPIPAYTVGFGQGCSGLSLGASGSATIGSTDFAAEITGAVPNQVVTLRVSTSIEEFAGLPLPLDLDYLGASGCQLLVGDATEVAGVTGASGEASLPVPLPTQPALAGSELFLQALATEPSFGQLGVSFSGALAVTVGS